MTSKVVEKRDRRVYSAREKCQAVLSAWTEKRKGGEICRELGINWAVLNFWQNRALEGMLEALDPKRNKDQKVEALAPRLKGLLEKKLEQREGKLSRLEQRLMKIQDSKEPVPKS